MRIGFGFIIIQIFCFLIVGQIFSEPAHAACFDPAIEAGSAYKDQLTESLVVIQTVAPARGLKIGDTVAGVGIKGQYFGCKISQAVIASKTRNAKKFSLYLPLPAASVQGFEIDISIASRRILAARAIQVPWAVVDRTQGVTAACSVSNPTAFEGFLYGALRNAKSRRCTQVEIEAFVGQPRPVGAKSSVRH